MDEIVNRIKLAYRFPKVSSQLPTLPIGPGLVRFGYNPTIIEDDMGRTLVMVYRYHDGEFLSSRLALATLDRNGHIKSNRALASLELSMEDPKLFWHRNQLHLSWVESSYPTFPFKSVVKYGRLADGEIVDTILPRLPDNDMTTMQKNYVFFEFAGDLFCIYRRAPVQRVFRLKGEEIADTYECPGMRWFFGEPRGGSPPLFYEGKLISFFHSSLDNELQGPPRRYYMGAVLMEYEPPFRPVDMSMDPILFGSEVDDVPVKDWPLCVHRKGQVVFPGGAVQREDHWLVAVGVNDYECLIVKVTPKDLKL